MLGDTWGVERMGPTRLSIGLSSSVCLPFVSSKPPDRREGGVATPHLNLDLETFAWSNITPWGSLLCLFCCGWFTESASSWVLGLHSNNQKVRQRTRSQQRGP